MTAIPQRTDVDPAKNNEVEERQSVFASMNSAIIRNNIDAHSIALLRCMIAVTVLLTSLPSSSAPLKIIQWTFGSFLAYCLYAFAIAAVSYRRSWQFTPKPVYWIDVGFISWLVALTYPLGNSLYQCFFYPIFIASFNRGFREGFQIALAAFLITIAIGSSFAIAGSNFGLGQNNMLIVADYILVVGYMISYCGGYGGLFMRKLALLKEMNELWHPRVGVDQMYGNNLDRILSFFDGEMCTLVLRRENPNSSYVMYTAYRDKPGHALVQHDVAESAADTLLNSLGSTLAVYYHDPSRSLWRRIRGHLAYDVYSGQKLKPPLNQCEALANLLDTKVFATVPFIQRGAATGRIFLTASHGTFNSSDVDFLSQASNTMATVVESMQLVEELVSKAAEQERASISRDLHDTTIQPYIGLKLALEAMSRETLDDNPLARRIRELIEMTEVTVRDLRDFAATIKGKQAVPGEAMVAAIKTHAERLKRFYGITVDISDNIPKRITGRLASEIFQIMSEGLSNILRHTRSKNAFLSIACESTNLVLKIGNDQGELKNFTPRSITERARALGGSAFVEHNLDHHTVVVVVVPL